MTPKLIQLTSLPRVVLVKNIPSNDEIEKELGIFGHDEGLTESEFKNYILKVCPPDTWRIVSKLSEVTEDQAKTLVKSKDYPCYSSGDDGMYPEFTHNEIVYADYKGDESDYKDTALESFHSAIKAEGIECDPEHTLILERI